MNELLVSVNLYRKDNYTPDVKRLNPALFEDNSQCQLHLILSLIN